MRYCYSGGTQLYTVPAFFQIIKHLFKIVFLYSDRMSVDMPSVFNMKGLMHCRNRKSCHFLPFSNSWHKYWHHSFQGKNEQWSFQMNYIYQMFFTLTTVPVCGMGTIFLSDIQPTLTKPCMYVNFMLKFHEESVKGRFSSEDGEETRSLVWLSVSYVCYPIKTNSEYFQS